MDGAIAWFVRNPVAANLLMVSIVVGGALTLPQIKQEVFPEVELGLVSVSVEYPGASPAEIEESITIRIEEQLQGVEGIKRITSTSREGVGAVTAELFDDASTRRVLDDVKTRVDAIDTFPEEAERPVIQEVLNRQQVINVAVAGDADERTLKRVGEQVRDELAAQPEITQVELVAVRPYEISIEVSEDRLRRHGLTFDEVAAAVRKSSLDLPGGTIRARGGEILLRSKGQAYRGDEFAALPLRVTEDGTRLLLGDVATIVDGFRETDQFARFDGKPGVLIQVFRVGEQNALEVAGAVHRYLADSEGRFPTGISLTAWQDDTLLLRSRRDLLLRNGRDGFLLVILVLALFLQPRIALWVSAGVPIALLGALWVVPIWGVSINMLSLFAFLLVLGILVDDAIVTGENIYRHQEREPDPVRAAIDGAKEISTPVVFGVLTTMAAFAPMFLLPGVFGRLIVALPTVVVCALFWSLVESKFVLPAHLAHARRAPLRRVPGFGWLRDEVAAGLERFILRAYAPFLNRCLRNRYLAAAVGLALCVVTLAWVASGRLRFAFFPNVEGDNVVAQLTMPEGTPVEVTAEAIASIEAAALAVRRESEGAGEAVFQHVLTSLGEQPYRSRQSQGPAEVGQRYSGGHLGEVNIELVPSEGRNISAQAIVDRWRDRVGVIPDAVELTFASTIFSTGKAIDVQLRGRQSEQLEAAADALATQLAEYPGVYDIASSHREGKRELRLQVRSSAEALGLSLADLARQVRQAFYGEEAQRIQRGRDDVRIMVRFPASQRRSLADIENMRIRLPDGTAVPFAQVAHAELGRGYSTIRRADRQRVIHVTADVDVTRANANEILGNLERGFLPGLLAEYPALSYRFEGERREQSETLANFQRGFILSLIAIFALLAIPLGSYVQPLIIMSAIPYGIMGAVWGHLLTGRDLSMLSVIGVLAATGVVVNDSLVMVSFVNDRVRDGEPLRDAIGEAGVLRFRPIVLTSLTTFVGLTPIMLERSLQAQFLIPMATSLAFGVLFATVATLLLIPAHYWILEDLRKLSANGGAPAPWRPTEEEAR